MIRLNQTTKHTLHSAFLLMLPVFFAMISFVVVVIGFRQYHSIANRMTQNHELRNASTYLTEAFHQHAVAGAISIIEFDGMPAISFTQAENRQTLVYAYENYLRELTISNSSPIHPDAGKKICKMSQLRITEGTGSLYCLTLTDSHGNTALIYFSLHAN